MNAQHPFGSAEHFKSLGADQEGQDRIRPAQADQQAGGFVLECDVPYPFRMLLECTGQIDRSWCI